MVDSQIKSALAGGIRTLSSGDTVTFTQYVRTVLPADGFVFWVKNDILGPGNQVLTNAPVLNPEGSLHYAAQKRQEATGSATATRVVFTTQQPLHQGIEQTNPPTIYIGEYDGLRFSFASFNNYYRQADTWHYVGDAVYSDIGTQIVDSPADLVVDQVLCNSTPLWLALSGYVPSNPAYGYSSPCDFYPSFLVPNNLVPPYATVDVESAESMVAAPYESPLSSDAALTREAVAVTTYGLRNEQARRLIMCVQQRSVDYGEFGLLNSPVVRDDKQTQVELGVLAMRKTIRFEICYSQGAVRNIARQLIEKAVPSFTTIPPNFYTGA